jgi:hypothetical protein
MNRSLRPILAAALAGLLLSAASPLRADDEPEGEAGTAIGADAPEGDGAGPARDAETKKPARSSAGSSSSSGGGGGGGGFAAPLPAKAKAGAGAEAAPAGDDWLHTAEGPDTPARHRKTTVPVTPPEDTGFNAMETFNPFRSVANAETCYQASKIFVLWQQWHFRRMNRVADNASGCPNVPVAEQAKIRLIQGHNQVAFNKMDKLAAEREGDHGPFDDRCDEIIAVYHDNLAWSNLSMVFKGRYMTRCAPAYTVGADFWPRECPADAVTGAPATVCSPPLPKN